jgi:hypothetical protein
MQLDHAVRGARHQLPAQVLRLVDALEDGAILEAEIGADVDHPRTLLQVARRLGHRFARRRAQEHHVARRRLLLADEAQPAAEQIAVDGFEGFVAARGDPGDARARMPEQQPHQLAARVA